MTQLCLYTRAGCHLCDEFLAGLQPLQAELGLQLTLRDVDDRPEWAALYGQRVPLLTREGEAICQYFLDEAALRSALAAAA